MAPPPFLPPVCRSTAACPQIRFNSSTRSQARLYDMSIARPAAEIEPQAWMFSRSAILPGPIRPPSGSRSMRTLREGSELALDFGMAEYARLWWVCRCCGDYPPQRTRQHLPRRTASWPDIAVRRDRQLEIEPVAGLNVNTIRRNEAWPTKNSRPP